MLVGIPIGLSLLSGFIEEIILKILVLSVGVIKNDSIFNGGL